jgi:hypothetical protein
MDWHDRATDRKGGATSNAARDERKGQALTQAGKELSSRQRRSPRSCVLESDCAVSISLIVAVGKRAFDDRKGQVGF